jgi:hypothetical protein
MLEPFLNHAQLFFLGFTPASGCEGFVCCDRGQVGYSAEVAVMVRGQVKAGSGALFPYVTLDEVRHEMSKHC